MNTSCFIQSCPVMCLFPTGKKGMYEPFPSDTLLLKHLTIQLAVLPEVCPPRKSQCHCAGTRESQPPSDSSSGQGPQILGNHKLDTTSTVTQPATSYDAGWCASHFIYFEQVISSHGKKSEDAKGPNLCPQPLRFPISTDVLVLSHRQVSRQYEQIYNFYTNTSTAHTLSCTSTSHT